jgi:hypothetical protein
MELVVLAVVLGLVVIVLWPVAKALQRRPTPLDQEQVTDTDVAPPPVPDEPVPGSREHRRRHGKP